MLCFVFFCLFYLRETHHLNNYFFFYLIFSICVLCSLCVYLICDLFDCSSISFDCFQTNFLSLISFSVFRERKGKRFLFTYFFHIFFCPAKHNNPNYDFKTKGKTLQNLWMQLDSHVNKHVVHLFFFIFFFFVYYGSLRNTCATDSQVAKKLSTKNERKNWLSHTFSVSIACLLFCWTGFGYKVRENRSYIV